MITVSTCEAAGGGGGDSRLVLVGICCWEFENGPIHIPIFQEKVTTFAYQLSQFWAKF